jgi:hypothetical protein
MPCFEVDIWNNNYRLLTMPGPKDNGRKDEDEEQDERPRK